ncbi:MAG: fatty acid desaturase family protein [Planctomycetales bacterium]|nr:fatty acid desaturase family protein [Planctomycetales bacterium]
MTSAEAPPRELPDAAEGLRHVPVETLRALSRIRPGRVAGAIAWNWAVLASLVALALATRHPAVFVACALVIGNRQYALLKLTHECSHYLFWRGRGGNDAIGNVFCAYPIGISVARYRAIHFLHHRHLGSREDPDWGYYGHRVTRGRLARIVLGGLLGERAFRTGLLYFLPALARRLEPDLDVDAIRRGRAGGRGDGLGILLAQGALFGAFVAAGAWWAYPLLWLLPNVTVLPVLNHLRTVAEHAPDRAPEGAGSVPTTRTTLASLFERTLLAPVQFYYHHEHHLFPSVPFYRLRDLHEALEASGYFGAPSEWLKESFARTLGELTRKHAPRSPPG